ncbi:MAG: hypothetical protein HY718_06955 [Planctomycetes bacterium]|nr:hypothetical protein [Planctomycetota bacterium]
MNAGWWRRMVVVWAAALVPPGAGVFGNPHFLIDSKEEWEAAMGEGKIQPMTSAEWGAYMNQWMAHLQEGTTYPSNQFRPPVLPTGQLYVYGGGGAGWPADAGLVMLWQHSMTAGNYSSAWKYDYRGDPDLSNVTITVTVTPPQFGLSGQINTVSFGIRDINGFIRAWHWNCGPGGLPWNVPTTITINTAIAGLAAANPVATGYMSHPLVNLANAMFLLADENCQWVGGPMPAPPPGGQIPGVWNYWHNIIVSPNIPPKGCDPTKWSQPVVEYLPGLNPPLFYGWDEKSDYFQPPIVADDWLCTTDKPVTDIHWWGSFLGWSQPSPPPLPQAFHIAIWTDVPAGADLKFSHPGTLIWQVFCTNYRWNFAGYDRDPRMPNTDWNEACFQFNQDLLPDEYFYQQPGPNGQNVYWLSIAAIYTAPTQFPWGWKTRPHYFNDDAVRIWFTGPTWPPTIGSRWIEGQPIEYPDGTSWDLAFELTTKKKWHQPPDLSTDGIDVKATRPNILADDFLCTKPTLITDVTVWGSWRDDQLPSRDPSNVAFTLSIHSDIPDPDGPTGPAYSMPGQTLWHKFFPPGTFKVRRYADNIDEGWWDPAIATAGYIFPGDHVCWQYDFLIDPIEAFCQRGSAAQPIVYWLDLQAAPQAIGVAGCLVADKGTGTADLPPIGCEYPTPYDDMRIVDGLKPGDTIEIDATHGNFSCPGGGGGGSVCSVLMPPGICEQPGGSLGGHRQCFDSLLMMPMMGTGSLAAFNRMIQMPMSCETHTAPRMPGNPVQSFDTDMFRMFGQAIGDPDFDLLRITAGTDFGMPSPGHTTLTQQGGGNWAVDSFFDITYRIDFVGAPGGPLSGMSGSTTGTIRFQIVGTATNPEFGWKTSQCHWNDDAVWGQGVEPYPGPWGELRYPPGHRLYPQSLDLAFAIDGDLPCQEPERDWGDAPDPTYPTLAASAGANHVIVPGMFLGATIDAETDGQPNADATGDDVAGVDDEDGVVFLTSIARGKTVKVDVTASAPGMLDAWMDFNRNGSWADAGEQIFASTPLAAGVNSLSFVVPTTAKVGRTFSRWRYSSAGGLPFTGPAADGEVEDYIVTIVPAKIIRRHVFYNQSFFDGNKIAIDPAPIAGANNDDADAIDTGGTMTYPGGSPPDVTYAAKAPLMVAGGMATHANWTGYNKGINGLIYDVENPSRAPVMADFTFHNIGKAGTVVPGPGNVVIPTGFLVQAGLGAGGSDRVIITFANGAVLSAWLQVDIGTGFGLELPETHWWGNADGDTGQGNPPPNVLVSPTDEIWIRTHPTTPLNRSKVFDACDVNKDGLSNPTDQIYARTHPTTPLNCVKMIVR